MRLLIAECEPPEGREERRESVGLSSGETYVETLRELVPDADFTRLKLADRDEGLPREEALQSFDGVFLTGSPLHLYEQGPEVERVVDFMRAVFASGTPSFGSCAGLQVATVAAGGRVRPMGARREAGFARRIHPTREGLDHPLLAGRPPAFDAPAVHGDEVEALPPGSTLLASNSVTQVQAAEIRFGPGVFWGVQYHPEISLREVAAALRRQADDLIAHALAADDDAVDQHAALIDALHAEPERRDLAWRLGLDGEVTDPARKTRELRNFIDGLVRPRMSSGHGT